MDATRIENWPTEEEIIDKLEKEGIAYCERVWKILQAKGITLNKEMSDRFYIVQKYYIDKRGYSLPATIKGARQTKAQIRDELGPEVDESKVERAVKGGLAARLAKMRSKR